MPHRPCPNATCPSPPSRMSALMSPTNRPTGHLSTVDTPDTPAGTPHRPRFSCHPAANTADEERGAKHTTGSRSPDTEGLCSARVDSQIHSAPERWLQR